MKNIIHPTPISTGVLHSGEPIRSGKLHADLSPATYRTEDGKAYFKFRYVKVGHYFEIDIIKQPSYNSRKNDQVTTHRLSSSRNQIENKICITSGHEPHKLEKAKKISMEWAELTHKYIKTGQTIDSQVRERAASNHKNGSQTKSSVPWYKRLFTWRTN